MQGLEGYVGDLELICSLFFQCDRERRRHTMSIDGDGGFEWKDKLMNAWNEEDAAERLRNVWRETEVFQELRTRNPNIESIDDNLFKKKRTGDDSFHSVEGAQGLDSSTESAIVVDDSVAGTEKSTKTNQGAATPNPQQFKIQQIPKVGQSSNLIAASPELPSRSWHLLDIYFTHTHSWLPIVEKHDILRTYHESSISGRKTSKRSSISGLRAVLWSILAFADVHNTSIDNPNTKELERASLSTADLYTYARSLIPEEDGVFDIGHVQSLLILSLLNLGANKPQAAWLLSGQAVRIAFQLGLNQRRDMSLQTAGLSATTREKHVLLGCFAVDTLIAARLGRPPHLTAKDIDVIGGAIEENGLEEWDAWSDTLGSKKQEPSSSCPPLICSTFNKFIVTLRTLNNLAREAPSNGVENPAIRATISALQASHNDKNSPEELSLNWSQDTTLLPHHFNLHLAYLTVMMSYLLRRHELFNVGNAAESSLGDLSHLVIQMSQVLTKFEDSFGLAIAPPITEYFVSILQDSYRVLERNPRAHTNTIKKNWRATLRMQVSKMHTVWPAFRNLQEALQEDLIMEGAADKAIFQNDFGLDQDLTSKAYSDKSPLDITAGMVRRDINNSNNAFGKTLDRPLEAEISQPSHSFSPTFESGRAAIAHFNTMTSPPLKQNMTAASDATHSVELAGDDLGVESSSTFSVERSYNTNPAFMPELQTNVDPDVMFKEFAILDAMEW
jgi:hypothetical protein